MANDIVTSQSGCLFVQRRLKMGKDTAGSLSYYEEWSFCHWRRSLELVCVASQVTTVWCVSGWQRQPRSTRHRHWHRHDQRRSHQSPRHDRQVWYQWVLDQARRGFYTAGSQWTHRTVWCRVLLVISWSVFHAIFHYVCSLWARGNTPAPWPFSSPLFHLLLYLLVSFTFLFSLPYSLYLFLACSFLSILPE